LKIAIVVPPWVRVPPEGYGGIELVVGLLADGLVKKGHEVTLYTVGSSRSKAGVKFFFEHPMFQASCGDVSSFLNVAVTHSLWAYMDIEREGYDVVHDNTWKEGLACARFISTPVVHTIHGNFNWENRKFYGMFVGDGHVGFVTVSRFLMESFPGLNYLGVVYNAVDVSRYPFREEKEDYYVYVGRFNEEKAPHIACKVASELGVKLYLAGKVREEREKEYFNAHVKPYLNDNIKYLGEVSEEEKLRLLSHAKAYLFPIQWDEPFGITMIEALACGTPVVTFRRGSAPEVVEHCRTGFVVDTVEEFAAVLSEVEAINPRKCRERVEETFSVERMVDGYEKAYREMARKRVAEPWLNHRLRTTGGSWKRKDSTGPGFLTGKPSSR